MTSTVYELEWEADDDDDIIITDNRGSRITQGAFVPLTRNDLVDMLLALGQVPSASNIVGGSNE